MFQLIKIEVKELRFQFETTNMSGRLAYAFLNKVLQESFLNLTKNNTTLRSQIRTANFISKHLTIDIKKLIKNTNIFHFLANTIKE